VSALPAAFYARPTLEVARDLVGKVLVHRTRAGLASGMIVEVEAYIGEGDPACHAAPGPTARNAPLYGPPGRAYVYLNYGMHYLVNAVTEPEGSPAAVLIRALAPIDGIDLMRRRRARGTGRAASAFDGRDLTRALGIDLRQNRADLAGDTLFVEDRGLEPGPVRWGPRVGIRVGVEHAWRCAVDGHPAVSSSPPSRPGRRPRGRGPGG